MYKQFNNDNDWKYVFVFVHGIPSFILLKLYDILLILLICGFAYFNQGLRQASTLIMVNVLLKLRNKL